MRVFNLGFGEVFIPRMNDHASAPAFDASSRQIASYKLPVAPPLPLTCTPYDYHNYHKAIHLDTNLSCQNTLGNLFKSGFKSFRLP